MAFTRLRSQYFSQLLTSKTTVWVPESMVPRESYHLYCIRVELVRPLPPSIWYDYESDEIVNGIALHFIRNGFTVKTQRVNRRKWESEPFSFSEAIGDVSYVYPDKSLRQEVTARISKTGRTDYTIISIPNGFNIPLVVNQLGTVVWDYCYRFVHKSGHYMNTNGCCADTIEFVLPEGFKNRFRATIIGWV